MMDRIQTGPNQRQRQSEFEAVSALLGDWSPQEYDEYDEKRFSLSFHHSILMSNQRATNDTATNATYMYSTRGQQYGGGGSDRLFISGNYGNENALLNRTELTAFNGIRTSEEVLASEAWETELSYGIFAYYRVRPNFLGAYIIFAIFADFSIPQKLSSQNFRIPYTPNSLSAKTVSAKCSERAIRENCVPGKFGRIR